MMHDNSWQRGHLELCWSPPILSGMAVCKSLLEGKIHQGCLAMQHASHLQGCAYRQATSLQVMLPFGLPQGPDLALNVVGDERVAPPSASQLKHLALLLEGQVCCLASEAQVGLLKASFICLQLGVVHLVCLHIIRPHVEVPGWDWHKHQDCVLIVQCFMSFSFSRSKSSKF